MTDTELEYWLDRADFVCLQSCDDPLYAVMYECLSHLAKDQSFLTRELAEYALVAMTQQREALGIIGKFITTPSMESTYGYH